MDDASQHLLKSLTSFGSDTAGVPVDDIGVGAAEAPGCAAYVVPLLHIIGLAMVTAAAFRHMGAGGKRQRIAAADGTAAAGSTGVSDDSYKDSSAARSIVFRDDLRRQRRRDPNNSTGSGGGDIPGYTPAIRPLRKLELGPADSFRPLLERRPTTTSEGDGIEDDDDRETMMQSSELLTDREETVLRLLLEERAVVKTMKNSDWTRFLERLHGGEPFRTSTSLLPSLGRRMRCYGSSTTYTVGVVFALPSSSSFDSPEREDEAASSAGVWCWPSGYAAKTEYNVDRRSGELVHGRREALVSVSALRRSNRSYLNDEEYVIGGRTYHRGDGEGFGVAVPYNEMYLRIGGAAGKDVTDTTVPGNSASSSSAPASLANSEIGSYEAGLGPPIALFVRTATFSHLVSMLRTRARLVATAAPEWRSYYATIPLLFITHDRGTIVLTGDMRTDLLRCLANEVEPFQNSAVYRAQSLTDPDPEHMRQKVQEFLDLNDEAVVRSESTTAEERARIAGGFGATDASVLRVFEDASSREENDDRTPLQSGDVRDGGSSDDNEAEDGGFLPVRRRVQEGLVSAVRAADLQTARQLLILYYSFAALKGGHRHVGGDDSKTQKEESENSSTTPATPLGSSGAGCHSDRSDEMSCHKWSDSVVLSRPTNWDSDSAALSRRELFATSPPPLRTDRLRSATDSDGLLIVLGAAEILRSMHNGVALRRRLGEAARAIEEWIANGEQSLLFRLASWKDQRAAQHDLKIAMERSSNFTAFVGYHAIVNRKKFASLLRRIADGDVVDVDDGVVATSALFLRSIHDVVTHMNRPCLRLELLQYILGLDNRYSVTYITDSVELAAACLTYGAAQSKGGSKRKR